MTNQYIEICRTFSFLECAVRQDSTKGRCRDLPQQLRGRQSDAALRDFIFCQMLVAIVSQLEDDIDALSGIPFLHKTWKLEPRLMILRKHFSISSAEWAGVDRIRIARNRFVHDGEISVNPNCTRAQVPGIVVSFLHSCQHPSYP